MTQNFVSHRKMDLPMCILLQFCYLQFIYGPTLELMVPLYYRKFFTGLINIQVLTYGERVVVVVGGKIPLKIEAVFSSTYHTKQLNQGQTHQVVMWQLQCGCAGKMEPPSTSESLTRSKMGCSKSSLGNLQYQHLPKLLANVYDYVLWCSVCMKVGFSQIQSQLLNFAVKFFAVLCRNRIDGCHG